MKWKPLGRPAIYAAIFASGFLVSASTSEYFDQLDPHKAVSYAKSLIKKAVSSEQNEPTVQPDEFTQPKLVDVTRTFVKTVTNRGELKIDERDPNSFSEVFSSPELISESADDAIYERFSSSGIERRITFNRNSEDFPLNLVRLIASVVKHGSRDDSMSQHDSLNTLKSRQLSMTCGSVSLLTKQILKDHGAKSRVVTTLTLDEWNTYSNGHTLLEIYLDHDKSWVAVDLDTNKTFITPEGKRASALDFTTHGISALSIVSLTSTPVLDYSGFPKYQSTAEYMVYNLPEWYKKMIQAVAIYDKNSQKYVFLADNESIADRVKSYSSNYTSVSRKEFVRMFYPGM